MSESLDLQIDYWNKIGPTKTFAHPLNLPEFHRWVPLNGSILDYGCGYGRALGILQSEGFENLIGADPAPMMIATARERFPAIAFEVLHGFHIRTIPDASIDAVLLFAVLTCVPTDAGQRAVLAEITRVLQPSGVLYISDMWLQSDQRNRERYELALRKYGLYGVFDLPEGVTVRHHSPEWFDELTSDYELLSLHDLQVQTMNGHPANGFQWFGRKRNFTT